METLMSLYDFNFKKNFLPLSSSFVLCFSFLFVVCNSFLLLVYQQQTRQQTFITICGIILGLLYIYYVLFIRLDFEQHF
eukprot:UN04250